MFLIYGSSTFMGYFSFLNKTPPLIIDRPVIPGKSDILMKIARIAITFNVMTCLPVNINPCRAQIFNFIGTKGQPKKFNHALVTFIILFGTMIIACIYPKILDAFSILGGTCSTMLVMSFPGILTIHFYL
jgi:amino acid permease